MNSDFTAAVIVEAQAKINLALRLQARDQTGYHPLETLFLRIELSDSLSIRTTSEKRSLRSEASDTGPAEQNLAWRAAEAYSAANDWPNGWQIDVEKRIPVGAGLGGGSADAGAVLRGLNAINPVPLSASELQSIAAALGADVPFMASEDVFALGTGYGDKTQGLRPPSSRPLALAIPDFTVGTSEAYTWLDADGDIPLVRNAWNVDELSWLSLDTMVENDFERVVARRHPVITHTKDAFLAAGARSAGLTGSGSVVFGLFAEASEMDRIALPPGVKLVRTRTSVRVVQPRQMG